MEQLLREYDRIGTEPKSQADPNNITSNSEAPRHPQPRAPLGQEEVQEDPKNGVLDQMGSTRQQPTSNTESSRYSESGTAPRQGRDQETQPSVTQYHMGSTSRGQKADDPKKYEDYISAMFPKKGNRTWKQYREEVPRAPKCIRELKKEEQTVKRSRYPQEWERKERQRAEQEEKGRRAARRDMLRWEQEAAAKAAQTKSAKDVEHRKTVIMVKDIVATLVDSTIIEYHDTHNWRSDLPEPSPPQIRREWCLRCNSRGHSHKQCPASGKLRR